MEMPEKPDETDCCGSGCNPCIFDVYENRLKMFKDKKESNKTDELQLQISSNCLDPLSYTIFQLVKCIRHTRNTFLYTFKYKRRMNPTNNFESSREGLCLSYKAGQHLLLRGYHPVKKTYFTRAYTPIPLINAESKYELTFSVMIKLYDKGVMSNIINQLTMNCETCWRGPYGNFSISSEYKYLLCIAQGTGIAPIYSVIDEMLKNENCETFITVLFCCCSGQDILLRDKLQLFSAYWNFMYEVYLTQKEEEFEAKYNEIVHRSKLNQIDIVNYMKYKDIKSIRILICGSETFNTTISGYFKVFGISEDQIHLF